MNHWLFFFIENDTFIHEYFSTSALNTIRNYRKSMETSYRNAIFSLLLHKSLHLSNSNSMRSPVVFVDKGTFSLQHGIYYILTKIIAVSLSLQILFNADMVKNSRIANFLYSLLKLQFILTEIKFSGLLFSV